MYFVGLDLAWGENNQTGIAVIDADGRLDYVGAATDDDSIAATVEPYVSGECLVGIDAPLVVNNPSGRRRAEAELSADFGRFDAGAHPANTGIPVFADVPRGARIAETLGLDIDPASQSSRRAIEVYPHPAMVVLFELDRTLKYKRGEFRYPASGTATADGPDRGTCELRPAAARQASARLGRNCAISSRRPPSRYICNEPRIQSTLWCAHTSRSIATAGRATSRCTGTSRAATSSHRRCPLTSSRRRARGRLPNSPTTIWRTA